MSETLPKEQRLYKKKAINQLFGKGKGFNFYPFRVVVYSHHSETDEPSIPRVIVSVSKKRFRRAVKRNKIKRIIREAWRRNKSDILLNCAKQKVTFDFALVYTATVILSYEEIEKKINLLSLRFIKAYLQDEDNITTAG